MFHHKYVNIHWFFGWFWNLSDQTVGNKLQNCSKFYFILSFNRSIIHLIILQRSTENILLECMIKRCSFCLSWMRRLWKILLFAAQWVLNLWTMRLNIFTFAMVTGAWKSINFWREKIYIWSPATLITIFARTGFQKQSSLKWKMILSLHFHQLTLLTISCTLSHVLFWEDLLTTLLSCLGRGIMAKQHSVTVCVSFLVLIVLTWAPPVRTV